MKDAGIDENERGGGEIERDDHDAPEPFSEQRAREQKGTEVSRALELFINEMQA
jgi:hypothetical protein